MNRLFTKIILSKCNINEKMSSYKITIRLYTRKFKKPSI